jgi:hypothetical protein
MRLRIEAFRRWGLMTALGGLLLCPGGALGEDFFGADFEAFTGIPPESAEAIDEGELDELRGGFLGFYFSVYFSGFVGSDGVMDGSLDVNANFGSESGNLFFETDPENPGTEPVVEGGAVGGGPVAIATDSATGEAFRVQAVVGDNAFNGAAGTFLITQVPGNNNAIGTGLTLNLAILQATDQNLATVQTRLDTLFGLP